MIPLVKSLQDRIKDGFIIRLMGEGGADYLGTAYKVGKDL
jgi:hypothetical protein